MRAAHLCALVCLTALACQSPMTVSKPPVQAIMAQVDAAPKARAWPCIRWVLKGQEKTPISKTLFLLDERGRLSREQVRLFEQEITYQDPSTKKGVKLDAYDKIFEYDGEADAPSKIKTVNGFNLPLSEQVISYDAQRRVTQRLERALPKQTITSNHLLAYDAQGKLRVERFNADARGQAQKIIVHVYEQDDAPPALDALVADQLLIYAHGPDDRPSSLYPASKHPDQALASWSYDPAGLLTEQRQGELVKRFTYDERGALTEMTLFAGAAMLATEAFYYDRSGQLIWSKLQDAQGQLRWTLNDYRCEVMPATPPPTKQEATP